MKRSPFLYETLQELPSPFFSLEPSFVSSKVDQQARGKRSALRRMWEADGNNLIIVSQ